MATTGSITEYLATAKHKGFVAAPRYYKDGDHLTYFAKPDRCYSKRVNELLTVYTSIKDGSLVGCKVKGVTRVMKGLAALHVQVSDGALSLGLFFISIAAMTREADSRKSVCEYGRQFADAKVPTEELSPAIAA